MLAGDERTSDAPCRSVSEGQGETETEEGLPFVTRVRETEEEGLAFVTGRGEGLALRMWDNLSMSSDCCMTRRSMSFHCLATCSIRVQG